MDRHKGPFLPLENISLHMCVFNLEKGLGS